MNSKHICKFCKRSFPCGRSLGGHIRSHLMHKNNSSYTPNEEPNSSKPRYGLRENPKKTYKDSNLLSSSSSPWSDESETEDGSDPNPRTRVQNPNGKSCSLGGKNHSNSSVSEVVELEQEEVALAMCLIMLSRDVGKWRDGSYENTEKIQGKNSTVVTNNSNRNSQNLKYAASGYLQNGSKMKKFEVFPNGFTSNDPNNNPIQNKRKFDDLDHKKTMGIFTSASGHVRNVSKIEFSEDGSALNDPKSYDHDHDQSGFDEIKMGSEIFKNTNKRSKFECTTCNKVFPSYQALGGHRASHKKMEGMKFSSFSKLESNEDQQEQEQELVTEFEIGVGSSSQSQSPKKLVQKHECPICFRVFLSGQALGGHKRSHILAANNSNNNCEINLVGKPSNPEMRDFLDLNLPPVPAEEEGNKSFVGLIKPYWWVENSHNHDPLLSLISN